MAEVQLVTLDEAFYNWRGGYLEFLDSEVVPAKNRFNHKGYLIKRAKELGASVVAIPDSIDYCFLNKPSTVEILGEEDWECDFYRFNNAESFKFVYLGNESPKKLIDAKIDFALDFKNKYMDKKGLRKIINFNLKKKKF